MQRLVKDISETSGISYLQAEMALGVVLSHLGARLPSPVMGRIRFELNAAKDKVPANVG